MKKYVLFFMVIMNLNCSKENVLLPVTDIPDKIKIVDVYRTLEYNAKIDEYGLQDSIIVNFEHITRPKYFNIYVSDVWTRNEIKFIGIPEDNYIYILNTGTLCKRDEIQNKQFAHFIVYYDDLFKHKDSIEALPFKITNVKYKN